MTVATIRPLSAWAESTPWTCLVESTTCCSPTHDHSPMAGDKCADCGSPMLKGERCFMLTERDGWVCWRHDAARGPDSR